MSKENKSLSIKGWTIVTNEKGNILADENSGYVANISPTDITDVSILTVTQEAVKLSRMFYKMNITVSKNQVVTVTFDEEEYE